MKTKFFQCISILTLLVSHSLFATWYIAFDGDDKEFAIDEFYGWKEIEPNNPNVDVAYVSADGSQKMLYMPDLYLKPVTKQYYEDHRILAQSWVDLIGSDYDNWELTAATPYTEEGFLLYYAEFKSKKWFGDYSYVGVIIYSLDETHVISACMFQKDKENLLDNTFDLLDHVWLTQAQ